MPSKFLLSLVALVATFLTACTAPLPSSADLDKLTKDIVARSFRAEGQAQLDRVNPDDDNLLCAQADQSGKQIDWANFYGYDTEIWIYDDLWSYAGPHAVERISQMDYPDDFEEKCKLKLLCKTN